MKKYIAHLLVCLLGVMYIQDVQAQQSVKTIRGAIYAESGEPISGAIIHLAENPAVYTASGDEGEFEIQAKLGQHLRIMYENKFKKIEITERRLKISFQGIHESEISLGYGQTRSQKELTAAVSIVGDEDLAQRSTILNAENMLYGKLLGLMTVSNSGSGNEPPGASFYIRGVETFRSKSPLILVDGFVHTNLRRLSPQSIESVSVLKDAAALAIYGQRGANGVILVQTKRGGNHPLNVQASYMQSLQKPLGLPEMVDAYTYAQAMNEARLNDGLLARYSERELQYFKSGNAPYMYPNVDWVDRVLRNYGTKYNLNVTFSGGGDVIQYFALLDYGHYNGIFNKPKREVKYKTQQKYGQLSFRTNLNINLTEELLLKFNVSAYMYSSNVPSEGTTTNDIFDAIYGTPSAAYPVRLPDGTWGGKQIYLDNPVAKYTDSGYGELNARQYSIDAIVRKELDDWLNGLNVKFMAHIVDFGSYIEGKNRNFQYGTMTPILDQSGNIKDSFITLYGENTALDYSTSFNNQERHSSLTGMLNYSNSFGSDRLDAMLLVQQSSSDFDNINNVHHYRKIAANFHYGFNGTYFLGVAASYAGRNLLPKGERYYFFPAVSAGWLISNENFLDDVSFLDRLKLRASWGITGMDDIPNDLPWKKGYTYGTGYYFGDDNEYQAGMNNNHLNAVDFGIARSYKTDVGIEIGLFNHLDVIANLFYAKRKNIVVDSQGLYSDVVGIEPPLTTNGVVENRGIEVLVRWQDTVGDFAYSINGQLTYAKNKILNKNEQYRPYDYMKRTGESVGQWFGLQAIGFFKDQQDIANSPQQEFSNVKPGDIKYKDQNNDGYIDKYDQVALGYTPYPELYYSFSVGLRYKNFKFSALFQGVGHMTAYLNTESVYWPLRDNTTISKYYYNHRWTPQTANTATLPRLTSRSNSNNFRVNSIWLRDQSYLKLRYVRLSYTLPASLVQSLSIDRIEIVAFGRNLLSWDNIPVGDVESFDSGYPLMRTYSLGLNITF